MIPKACKFWMFIRYVVGWPNSTFLKVSLRFGPRSYCHCGVCWRKCYIGQRWRRGHSLLHPRMPRAWLHFLSKRQNQLVSKDQGDSRARLHARWNKSLIEGWKTNLSFHGMFNFCWIRSYCWDFCRYDDSSNLTIIHLKHLFFSADSQDPSWSRLEQDVSAWMWSFYWMGCCLQYG